MRRWLILSLVLLVLTGCSALNPYHEDFGCEGNPDGVNCMSAREVYRLTDNKSALTPEDRTDKKGKKKQQKKMLENEIPAPPEGGGSLSDPPTSPVSAVQGLSYEGSLPVLSSPQVMRIWIAPWESQDGVLNLSTYMYALVMDRRWAIGEAKMKVAPDITPLQHIEAPDEAEAQKSGRPQQMRTPPRAPQRPPQQQQRALSRPNASEMQKAISNFPGFTGPMGQNPQQNVFPKSFPGMPGEN